MQTMQTLTDAQTLMLVGTPIIVLLCALPMLDIMARRRRERAQRLQWLARQRRPAPRSSRG